MSPLGGRGSCGLEHPSRSAPRSMDAWQVTPPAVIGCPMTASVDRWLTRSVQPAAAAYFRSRVVEIREIASYGCRTRNNHGVAMSEHAFGNALDVAAFRLADGARSAWCGMVAGGPGGTGLSWQLPSPELCRVLHRARSGQRPHHSNHFHLDLLPHQCAKRPPFLPTDTLWRRGIAELPGGDALGAGQRRHSLLSALVAKPINAAVFGRRLLLQERFAVAAFPAIILSRSGGFVEEVFLGRFFLLEIAEKRIRRSRRPARAERAGASESTLG